MLKPIRRVVTGHDAQGRSIVLSDAPAPLQFETPVWPGRGNTSVWSAAETPVSNEEADLKYDVATFPGMGGVSFMIVQLPPESELESLSPAQREVATLSPARVMPEALEIDMTRHYGMHATETLDMAILLSGELTMLLDEGEVTLKPFDTVVQRGTNHGWVNRGKEPAILAAAVVDAKPLVRKRKAKRYPKAG